MLHLGKVAIVTGSSRGIGKAIALQLAAEGADIAVCARSEQSTKELPGSIGETAALIHGLGRRAVAIRVDVTNDREVISMVQRVVHEFGQVDILVNNAALAGLAGPGKPFLESDTRLLDRFYLNNVRAPFVLSRLLGPQMVKAGGGAIINISSRMGRLPAGTERPGARIDRGYAISKAALDRFSAAIAMELLPYNIAVVTVYPGLTRLERLSGRTDVDLTGAENPEVTAKAVEFLCRNPMAYTGQFMISREVVSKNQL